MGLALKRNSSKQRTAEFFNFEDICKTSCWSDDENSKRQGLGRCGGTEISHQESKRNESLGRKERWRVFSVEGTWTVPEVTHAVSVIFTIVSGNSGAGQRSKWRSFSPASHSKAEQTDGEDRKSSKESGNKRGKIFRQKERNSALIKICTDPSCKFWHPHVCQNYKSGKGCVYGEMCQFRHVEAEEKPSKVKERRCNSFSCDLELVCTHGLCASRFLSEKVHPT